MDIYCPRCSEPWEMESLHEEVENRYSATKPWILNDRGVHDLSEGKFNQEEYEKYLHIVNKDFFNHGCVALGGNKTWCDEHYNRSVTSRGGLTSVAYDMMGDDVDGIASMMEDAEYMGMFDD